MIFFCCFIKCRFSVVVPFLLASLCGNAQEGSGPSWFDIKSKTVFLSAKCVIANTGEELDRTRKNVGIGESVELLADGKALDDGEAIVDWVLKEGRDLASLEKSVENDKASKLIIKKEGDRAGSVTIEAKAKKNGTEIASTTISFNIELPTAIKARHSGQRMEKYPVDGDRVNIGASSKLILILGR